LRSRSALLSEPSHVTSSTVWPTDRLHAPTERTHAEVQYQAQTWLERRRRMAKGRSGRPSRARMLQHKP
jgi:hypothetical protein